MAISVGIEEITSGYNLSKINSNFVAITQALADVVSRSGGSPNNMTSSLDMDSNNIINGGNADFESVTIGGTTFLSEALAEGDAGWSPQFAIASDGNRRVLQLTGYTGGEGTEPTENVGEYVSSSGYTATIGSATDIRGATGASGAGSGDMVAAQNLNDVADKPTAFTNIKQAATESATGVVELATTAEAAAGADTTRAVTAAGLAAALATILPIGVIVDYGGVTAPTKWLLCYGQAISRTTYSALFTAIGTTWGAGNGTTTFNVPDLRGRVTAGQDDMGGTSANRLTTTYGGPNGDTLGATGGSEFHSLTGAQNGPHQHQIPIADDFGEFGSTAVPNTNQTTILGYVLTVSSGSGDGHNNVQPTAITNKMIYAGV